MEIFDVIDKNDNVIGTATREECHSNKNLIHRTVHFTLVDKKNNKIMLTQRSFKKSTDPGKFCFLGEHVQSGETYEQALKRGFNEELGIKIKNTQELFSNFFYSENQTELGKFYVAESDTTEIKIDPAELEQVLWINIEDLKNNSYDMSITAKFWIDNIDWNKL